MDTPTKSQKTMCRRSKACQNCHDRKVKCVVEAPGTTCNNCILDDVECFFARSNRGRKRGHRLSRIQPVQKDEGGPIYTRGSLEVQHTSSWLTDVHGGLTSRGEALISPSTRHMQPDRNYSASRPQTRYLSPAAEEMLHQELSYTSLIRQPAVTIQEEDARAGYNSPPMSQSPTSACAAHCPGCNCQIDVELPTFVQPLPADLDEQNIGFLRHKGALDIPDIQLRSALIRSYIENLHPWMPFQNLDVVYGCLQAKISARMPKISLLLFQALMFGGCASCDLAELKRVGLSSRKGARKAYFERVRLLYDFDVEQDRLVVIQAVLLMTVWTNHADDDKGGWHWMGVAVTMAQSLGLHRNLTAGGMSAKERRQRRRLWWSCYIRDRMFVQALSRPTRIHPDEFDTPILDVQDFEFIGRPADVSEDEFQNVPVGDVENQQRLAELCVKLAELSVHVGTVIELHFSMIPSTAPRKFPNVTEPTSTPMLYPRSSCREEAVWNLDQKLQNWFLALPSFCTLKASTPFGDDSASLVQCRGYLHVAYFALISALHRPQLSNTTSTSERRGFSKDRVRHAANEMTSITQGLKGIGLLARAPTPLVMLHLFAITSHMQQLVTEDSNARTDIIRQIFHAVQAIEAMQEVYSGADIPASIISQLLLKAHIFLLKDHKGHLRGIRFEDRLYVLDEKSKSIMLQQDTVDETVSVHDKHQSPQLSTGPGPVGPAPSHFGDHDWDWSELESSSWELSPFLTDCGTTAGEDSWFCDYLAPSFNCSVEVSGL